MSYEVIISSSAVDYGRRDTLHANGFFSCLFLFLSFSFFTPKPVALGNISDNQGEGAPCTITLLVERKGGVCGGIGRKSTSTASYFQSKLPCLII